MWRRRIVGIVCCAFLMSVAITDASRAATGEDWVAAKPLVAQVDAFVGSTDQYCPVSRVEISVEGIAARRLACVFSADGFEFATYPRPDGQWEAAVALRFDDIFHPLQSICQGIAGCIYSPATDTLVSRFLMSNGRLGARILRHVRDRVSVNFDPIEGRMRYVFDVTGPDFILTDEAGIAVPIGAVAISENGKWLVAEYRDKGLIRLNLDNYSTRRIFAPGPKYGLGFDPKMELAIANDGSIIVMTGQNVDLRLLSVNDDCGERLTPPIADTFQIGTIPCRVATINPSSFVPSYRFALHPIIGNNGGYVRFDTLSTDTTRRRIVIVPGDSRRFFQLEYLALGDSFSSGEGEESDSHYLRGTNHPPDICHVSDRSYPFLLAHHFGIADDSMKSVACSGARSRDVTPIDVLYQGQRYQLSDETVEQRQHEALQNFQPGWVKQGSFVATYHPKIITIGIGGNDVGFMDKLKACVMPGTCEWVERRHEVAIEIRTIVSTLEEVFRRLVDESPSSKLYVMGYPQIMGAGSCDALLTLMLNEDERQFMREGVRLLNQVIRLAASRAKAIFVDSEQSLEGGRLCEENREFYAVNGLRLGDDLSPLTSMPWLKIIGMESFHPTSEGHQKVANRVIAQYPDFGDSGCECLGDTGDLVISDYWKNSDSTTQVRLHNERFLLHDTVTTQQGQIDIAVSVGAFAPNSQVRVEIHSDQYLLGVVTTHGDGSLKAGFELPSNIAEGYHTVHLYGRTMIGEEIDVYQALGVDRKMTSQGPVDAQNYRKDAHPVASKKSVIMTAGNNRSSVFVPDILGSTIHIHRAGSARHTKSRPIYDEVLILACVVLVATFVTILIMKYGKGRGG